MGKRGRRALVVLGLAGLAGAAYVALQPAAVPVEVATVTRGTLRVTVDEDAETRVRERFVVSAPVAGRITRIALEPGDEVAANETVLVEFLPAAPPLLDARTRAELQARLEAAEAGLARARAEAARVSAELAQAGRVLARSTRLAASGAIAAERLEADQLAVRTLEDASAAAAAAVRAAEWDVAGARASLQGPASGRTAAAIRMRAPVDGVVLRRWHESEAVVAAGTPLIEIGDVSRLEIVSDMLSTDAVSMKPGQPALVDNWGGSPFEARIRRVEPSAFTKVSALGVEEQRVKVIFEVASPPPEWSRIGDGFRLTVRVVVADQADVLKVPTSSLVRLGSAWSVFLVDGDRARQQRVEVGARNDREAAVVEGVAAGARVVVYPGDTVSDGVRVRVE